MLVGAFAALFGTHRGQLLQQWAAARGVALTWGVGPGKAQFHHHGEGLDSFAGDLRLLDLPSSAKLVNASATTADATAFDALWTSAAAARDATTGAIESSVVWELWARAQRSLSPSLQLAVPRVGECADWTICLGRSAAGWCVGYDS